MRLGLQPVTMSGFALGLMGHRGMEPFGFFPFGLLNASGSLLIVAGVVLLAVWAFRAIARPAGMAPSHQPVTADSPQDILARRFATGDITAEEYQRAREVLAGSPAPPP
jgi:uncharacterized membrane protein